MNPPAVNGNMHEVAKPLIADSNIKLKSVPDTAPNAVNNCKYMAFFLEQPD